MLGHINIIDAIICETYNNEFKHSKTPRQDLAMEVAFNLTVDYEKEDGYRHLFIRLFGTGYVTVLSNETWIVANANDMHLESPKYDEGQTGWKFLGCHDSCWRDSVHRVLQEYADRLMNINTTSKWYKTINLTDEELDLYRNLERKEREY